MRLSSVQPGPVVSLSLALLAECIAPLVVFSVAALAPLLRDSLRLSREPIGSLTACFFAGAALAGIPMGWVAARFGVRVFLIAVQAVNGLGRVAMVSLHTSSGPPGGFAGMRATAAVIGSGMLDRFPGLRVGLVETGHGWLASWAFHVDAVADMVGHASQPLRQKPSEYLRGPQDSPRIELHEGAGVLKSIIELLGPDTLMFATDYPQTECWFPESVEAVLGWSRIPDDAKRQLLWDNGG
jgi:predicted TIM-barrel fold metal-dependent hydrolase